MGFFGFGKKEVIKSSVLKISTGIAQVEEELNTAKRVTPVVRGILMSLQGEVKELESLLKTDGRTNWELVNTMIVKERGGKEIPLSLFTSKLYNAALGFKAQTGIDIRIWL